MCFFYLRQPILLVHLQSLFKRVKFFVKNQLKAEVAQLVELLICNQAVGGSSPFFGSFNRGNTRVAKWGRL